MEENLPEEVLCSHTFDICREIPRIGNIGEEEQEGVLAPISINPQELYNPGRRNSHIWKTMSNH